MTIFRDDPFGEHDFGLTADKMALDRKRNVGSKVASKSGTPAPGMQTPMRFVVRFGALTAMALLGYPEFATLFNGLLLLAVAFCVCVAELRRESMFSREFNHWDEAAAYGIVIGLISLLR